MFELVYHEKVLHDDIPKLARSLRKRIERSIHEKLTTAPQLFGKPLRNSLKGDRTLRVGDYRVVFRISGKKVLIFGIMHRGEIYQRIMKRM